MLFITNAAIPLFKDFIYYPYYLKILLRKYYRKDQDKSLLTQREAQM